MGGQAWLTYHLSGNEWVQSEYLHKKNPKDFIPGGTTQSQFKIDVVKRLRKEIELDAWYQHERWKAPLIMKQLPGDLLPDAIQHRHPPAHLVPETQAPDRSCKRE